VSTSDFALPTGCWPVPRLDGTVTAAIAVESLERGASCVARRAHRFTGTDDADCLVHLYEEYGDALPYRLQGFAFAVWAPAAGQ
jgi:asparagine synthase (glutamine-hydrolysing)